MSVRAKFKVDAIERTMQSAAKKGPDGLAVKDDRGHYVYEPCEMSTIKMSPVYGNGDPNHENTKFWQASPSGSFSLNCVNADAVKQFELGKSYYLDFTPAE
jgi:hypothetical protein